jgi:hypothetical protein
VPQGDKEGTCVLVVKKDDGPMRQTHFRRIWMRKTIITLLMFCIAFAMVESNVAQEKKALPVSSDTTDIHKPTPTKGRFKPRATKKQRAIKRDSVNLELYRPLLRSKDDTLRK